MTIHGIELTPDFYFNSNPLHHFPNLILWKLPLWNSLDHIHLELMRFFAGFNEPTTLPPELELWHRPSSGHEKECVLYARNGLIVESDLCLPEIGVFLASGVIIEPTAIIKAPTYIGPYTEVRQGAYIRGDVIVGSHCTIGHTTEIKSSIFLDHSEAGHFAYIGDSIIGACVNLGAGTKLANLPFRTFENKKDIKFDLLSISTTNGEIETNRSKIGAFLGDGVEIGCNSTLAPATFIGRDSWIYPCMYLPRGFYPPRSIIKPPGRPVLIPKRED